MGHPSVPGEGVEADRRGEPSSEAQRRDATPGAESDGPDTSPDPLDAIVVRAIVGSTATGKTAVALRVAEDVGAEIVSLDSMLVYRGLDVGTAKPSAAERARVTHHLVDTADPPERYDVQRYLSEVRGAVASIRARGREVLFVGGTGFYLKALVQGVFHGPPVDPELRARLEARAVDEGTERTHARLREVDPAAAERLHPNDVRRVIRGLEVFEQSGRTLTDWQREWKSGPGRPRRVVGLECPLERLEPRIAARAEAMLDAGWIEEARRVRDGVGFGPTSVQALGYREVLRLADGELSRAECLAEIVLRTRQFARRQATWWRNFADLAWVEAPRPGSDEDLERAVEQVRERLFAPR